MIDIVFTTYEVINYICFFILDFSAAVISSFTAGILSTTSTYVFGSSELNCHNKKLNAEYGKFL